MQTSLIDFSEDKELFSNLDGAAQKTLLLHDGKPYIVKFGEVLQPNPNRPDQGSYQHAPVSEHLSCMVFGALGLPVQNTLLGTFRNREVVACEDFTTPYKPNVELVPFNRIEGTMISSSERDRLPHLETMARVFAEHPIFGQFRAEALSRYWDTFIVDAIIANPDRHGGNWGYLMNKDPRTGLLTDMKSLAPVYDCGSSLAARISEEAMQRILENPNELKQRALGWPRPALIVGGIRPAYHDFLMSPEGRDARVALCDMAPRIAELDVHGIVSSVPCISQTRRAFYEATILSRIEHVLQPAYELALQEQGARAVSLVPGAKGPKAVAWTQSAPSRGGTVEDRIAAIIADAGLDDATPDADCECQYGE